MMNSWNCQKKLILNFYFNFYTSVLKKSIISYLYKEARRLLSDIKYHNITFEAITYGFGIASKSSFNHVFKNITGITTSFYLETVKTI